MVDIYDQGQGLDVALLRLIVSHMCLHKASVKLANRIVHVILLLTPRRGTSMTVANLGSTHRQHQTYEDVPQK